MEVPKKPLHPGTVIKTHILEPLGISVIELAHAISVPPNRLYLIIKGDREISIDTAVRLGIYLNMSPEFWLNLQMDYQITQYHRNHPETKSEITPLKTH